MHRKEAIRNPEQVFLDQNTVRLEKEKAQLRKEVYDQKVTIENYQIQINEYDKALKNFTDLKTLSIITPLLTSKIIVLEEEEIDKIKNFINSLLDHPYQGYFG